METQLKTNDSEQIRRYLAAADSIEFTFDGEVIVATVVESFEVEALVKTRTGAPTRHFMAKGRAGDVVKINSMGIMPESVKERFATDVMFLAINFSVKSDRQRHATQDTCPRCAGAGILEEFRHIDGGVCFKCDGTGHNSNDQ